MDIVTFSIIMILAFLGVAVAAFAGGPYVLKWFCETLQEWEEIIESLHGEK